MPNSIITHVHGVIDVSLIILRSNIIIIIIIILLTNTMYDIVVIIIVGIYEHTAKMDRHLICKSPFSPSIYVTLLLLYAQQLHARTFFFIIKTDSFIM